MTQADCSQSVGAYTAAAAATANLFIHEKMLKPQQLFSVQRLLDCRIPEYACSSTFFDTDGYSMLISRAASPHDYYGPFTGTPSSCKNTQAGLKQKFTKWSDVYPTQDKTIEDAL